MKEIKPTETQIIVFIPYPVIKQEPPKPPKKSKINQHLLKAINLIVVTLVIWLQPEATIAIALIKLLFIVLEWFNQKNKQ